MPRSSVYILRRCLPLAFALLLTSAHAEFNPPPEAVALTDPRMEQWSEAVRPPVRITGRIVNLSADNPAKPAISGSLVLAGPQSQLAKTAVVADDGTFQLELPAAYPIQQIWFRVGRLFYAGLLVSRGLHVEIDAANLSAKLTGPDGLLNEEVRRFQFQFRKERQNEIERLMREISLQRDAGDLGTTLGKLEDLHRESRALLDEFAPRFGGFILASDLDAQFYSAAIRASRGRERELVDSPLWPRVARHATWAITNEQTAFFRGLQGFLRGLRFGSRVPASEILAALSSAISLAPPAVRENHAAALALCTPNSATAPDSAEFKAALQRLSEAGWLSAAPAVIRGIQSSAPAALPTATLEFALIFAIPADAAEAVLAYSTLEETITKPWIRALLRDQTREAKLRLATANAALGARSETVTATPLGEPIKRLPAGAQPYRWPDLTGRAILDQIRAAFPGRALLLDFWGPWCHPCLEDLPHSRAMHAALKDRPIEFVYFACRTDPGAWQRSVADLRLAGTHVFLEPAQTAELMSLFGLGGFPGYAFLDRDGKYHPGLITRFANTKASAIDALLKP